MIDLDGFAEELMAQLSTNISFTIPIFGGIPVPESCVVTWVIMAVLVIPSAVITRHLELIPKGPQRLLEAVVGGLNNFFHGILGQYSRKFTPILGSIGLYLAVANVVGILGVKPPTKDLNITLALALCSIVLVEYAGIYAHGPKGWLVSFTKPVALVTPINILELFIRPLSLCMRLFGNILGCFIIIEMIRFLAPVFVPLVFGAYFDIFDGLIQAFVFVFLTTLFIKEAVE